MTRNKRKSEEDIQLGLSAEELIERTEAVEAEKEEKQRERLEKKRQKALKKRREKIEKLIGPFLLIVTIIVSILVQLLSKFSE